MVDAGIPSIHYGEIYTHYGVSATETLSHVREEIAQNLRFAEPGDVIIAGVGETVEDVAKAVAWLGATKVAIHDDSYAFRSAEDPTYIAYVMQTANFHIQKERYVARANVKRVGGENLGKIAVPVPPLEVQREIVRILKTFTELEADLEAELEARTQQYAHYRDALLSFNEGTRVRWATLSEIGSIYGGLTGKSKVDFTEGNAPFITYMNVFNNLSTDLAPNALVKIGPNERQTAVTFGDVLFTASSESREEVGMASGVTAEPAQPTYLNSFCFGFRPNSTNELDPEFAKHLFRARVMRDQIVKTANGVTRINISKGPFGNMTVPLPDLGEQKRIADVLDKFEALVNDLSSGLPAEIEARRQQYAYYRDRLLTFEEAAA